jgi:hypothetical protein
MPVLWDETRVLSPSAIGDLAIFARRSGNEWWVGVVHGGGQRNINIPMDFLGAGQWTADRYADGAKPTDLVIARDVPVSTTPPQGATRTRRRFAAAPAQALRIDEFNGSAVQHPQQHK